MMKSPQHVAIIMDGNGRWAQSRGHARVFGHVRGAKTAKNIIEAAAEMGLANLTLFTFSTENWFRPENEVNVLMRLLFHRLKRETPTLLRHNIRFHCLGEIERLPEFVSQRVKETIKATAQCTGMNLTFAISYGSRQEITRAAQRLAEKVARGELAPQDINEETLSLHMDSAFLPDPDLIIRTSGEFRLSNFFLWQAAYSEILISDDLWPDFSAEHFLSAIRDFGQRERRFGQTSAQLDSRAEQALT